MSDRTSVFQKLRNPVANCRYLDLSSTYSSHILEPHFDTQLRNFALSQIKLRSDTNRQIITNIEIVQARINIRVHKIYDVVNEDVPRKCIALVFVEFPDLTKPVIA